MKIAILILCHKNPEQINLLLKKMKHPSFSFFIHIDKKATIKSNIILRKDIVILPDDYRVDVQWGCISMVDATLNLLRFACQYDHFDFFWLCSGQDFPIKSMDDIINWFETHPNNEFLNLYSSKNTGQKRENKYDKRTAIYFPTWMLGNDLWKRVVKRLYTEITGGYNKTFKWARRKSLYNLKFYFGSQWFCLSKPLVLWILNFLNKNPEYYIFFRNCNCSDEAFLHTLVMNSVYAEKRVDHLHYIDFSEKKNHPKILTLSDLKSIEKSKKLLARKFDISIDSKILYQLMKNIKN